MLLALENSDNMRGRDGPPTTSGDGEDVGPPLHDVDAVVLVVVVVIVVVVWVWLLC